MRKFQECIYWILSLTWGVIPTAIGLLVTIILGLAKCDCYDNGFGLITEVGGNWGGVSFGPFALCGKYKESSPEFFDHTRKHEFGHSIQNCLFGPLWIFIVGIPSIIRYWIFYFRSKKGKPNPDYDSAWFECTASKWGTKAVDKIESK